ncbi:unnamed protein product [Urochloa humidicola]
MELQQCCQVGDLPTSGALNVYSTTSCFIRVFRKDNRTMFSRKDLFKDTLRKSVHAWKRIVLTDPHHPIYFH